MRTPVFVMALLVFPGGALAQENSPPLPPTARTATPAEQQAAEIKSLRAQIDATVDSSPEKPKLIFWLGQALMQAKQEDVARSTWQQLTTSYPQSVFVADAFLALGEMAFAKGDMTAALEAYSRALAQPRQSRAASYILYKKAWVYFELSNFKAALTTFIEVIQTASGPAPDKLVRAARKDLVTTFAQLGPPEKAWSLFQQYGGDQAQTMLAQLGEVYSLQGKYSESTTIYRELLRQTASVGERCGWQAEVVSNTGRLASARGPADESLQKELRALWELMDQPENAAAPTCRERSRKLLAELAMTTHKQAEKASTAAPYLAAVDLYKEYVRRFATDSKGAADSYLVTYYYGEALFKLGNLDSRHPSPYFCAAVPLYQSVVKMDPKGSQLQEAAYAALMASRQCLDIKDDESELPKGRVEDPQRAPLPIPPKQQKWLDALADYIQSVSAAPELTTAKYRRGRLFYEYNHYAEAVPLFLDIAEHDAKNEAAPYAASLALDCLAARNDIKTLATTVDKLLASPDLTRDADLLANLKKMKVALKKVSH